MTVYDAAGNFLAQDDDGGGGHDSRLDLEVVQGQTYYVQAGAFGPSLFSPASNETGSYNLVLLVAGDDFGNTTAEAADLPDLEANRLAQAGEIGKPGDVDVFRFVAPTTGGYVLRLKAEGSGLDGVLVLLDAGGNEIASNADGTDGGLDSRLDVSLTAGTTYYLRAEGFAGFSIGAYTLSITTVVDDFGNTRADASTVTLTNNRVFVQGGIEVAGDVDVFRFDALTTGGLVVRQSASRGYLDSRVTVFDSTGTQLAQNDDSDGS